MEFTASTPIFIAWTVGFILSAWMSNRLSQTLKAQGKELDDARVALAGAREQEIQAYQELSRARIALEANRTGETREQVVERLGLSLNHLWTEVGTSLVAELAEQQNLLAGAATAATAAANGPHDQTEIPDPPAE